MLRVLLWLFGAAGFGGGGVVDEGTEKKPLPRFRGLLWLSGAAGFGLGLVEGSGLHLCVQSHLTLHSTCTLNPSPLSSLSSGGLIHALQSTLDPFSPFFTRISLGLNSHCFALTLMRRILGFSTVFEDVFLGETLVTFSVSAKPEAGTVLVAAAGGAAVEAVFAAAGSEEEP